MADIIKITDLPSQPIEKSKIVLTIGNFDGLHLGHQTLAAKAVAIAKQLKTTAAALSFAPHPDVFFGKIVSEDLPLLTLNQKRRGFAELGIPQLHILQFDADVSRMSHTDFFEQVLLKDLNIQALVVGHDFCFGAKRQGNQAYLTTACQAAGIQLFVQSAVSFGDQTASSTLVRHLLVADGDVGQMRRLLGRPHLIEGTTVGGQQLGRRIGFPTINVSGITQLLPKFGVYAGWVYLADDRRPAPVMSLPKNRLPAVFNFGNRPTVSSDAARIHVEAHILEDMPHHVPADFAVGLYLGERLRDEQKFESIDALRAQIALDVAKARTIAAT